MTERNLAWVIKDEGVTYYCTVCSWTFLTRHENIGKARDPFDDHVCVDYPPFKKSATASG
ncbi:MAG TPA: hypothetical protein VJO53_01985 [Candidatus Acidoferrales bacterium]|nr:hypothetical protein [Candidatus Acidoferrales bacterium]